MAMVLPPGPCDLPTIKPLIVRINKAAAPVCISARGCRTEVECLNKRPLVIQVDVYDLPISSEHNA